MTPPRVALVTPPIQHSGGIGRVTSQFLDACPRDRAPVAVVDPRGPGTSPWRSSYYLPAALLRLRRLLRRRELDLVHVNISVHASTTRKLAVMHLVRRYDVPVVLHLHSGNYPDFFDHLPPRRQRRIRAAFQSAARVVVLGEVWRDYARDTLGVSESRIAILPNSVAGPAELVIASRRSADPLRIAFIGRLGEAKGADVLLAALTQLPAGSWTASMAGDGDVDRFRRQARDLGLHDVRFPGWLDAAETNELLNSSHVHVLPSLVEGLPMSVVEAMALGVTNIVTPVGAVPEVIRDGDNGLMVPIGDIDALAAALQTLLSDDDLRVRLARNARASWEHRYSIGRYADELTSIWAAASDS